MNTKHMRVNCTICCTAALFFEEMPKPFCRRFNVHSSVNYCVNIASSSIQAPSRAIPSFACSTFHSRRSFSTFGESTNCLMLAFAFVPHKITPHPKRHLIGFIQCVKQSHALIGLISAVLRHFFSQSFPLGQLG